MASPKDTPKRRRPPATTPEGRENQLISLAIDLAEQQLSEGIASSQVITHFLKLGTAREKLEKEIMEEQKKLLKAKTEAIEANKRVEELYKEALNAMRAYSGNSSEEDEFYED